MIDTDTLARLEATYGPIPRALSRIIRPAFIARPGKVLVWGDWSAIEARKLPWLAGSSSADKVLDIFRTNDKDPSLPDIYKIEAGNIYEKDPVEATKDERQVGKVAVLALGFGGGVGAFKAMATGYGISLDEALMAHIVKTWRANNPWAGRFWGELEEAFLNALEHPGEVFTAGRVSYIHIPNLLGGTTLCYLPDGTPLPYAKVRTETFTTDDIDEETGDPVKKTAIRFTAGYGRKAVWPGLLAENITQGAAAALLREKLTLMERKRVDFPGEVVAHTHDELICEVDEADAMEAAVRLKEIMEEPPAWAEGLPLKAEITTAWYYSKVFKELPL